MSLLRVHAFAKCLYRRSLFEKCAVRVSFADYCQLCVSIRNGAVRRISETPLQLQRRNVSSVKPKTEDTKKRVLEQSQLLDVLEARIHQLQSDMILDVQHAKVQFIKDPSSGRGVLSGKGPKKTPQEKTAIPKSGQAAAKGAVKSHWMEKLMQEKKNKLTKQQRLLKTMEKYVKEKPTAKCKGSKRSKDSQMVPGTTHKTISTATKKTIRKPLADEICAAVSLTATSSAGAGAASTAAAAATAEASKAKCKGSIKQVSGEGNQRKTITDAQAMSKEVAEVEELRRRLSLQAGQWTSSGNRNPECFQEGRASGTIQSFLEACVFAGDIERGHYFLLSQHRAMHQRKNLNTGIYNVMMKVWAKKDALYQISRMFVLLEEAGLKPNVESYCAALECMGRKHICSPDIVTRCLSQMEQDGLSVDDIFNQCVFRQDERDMVLKAVRIVQPDYEPSIKTSTSSCSPSLVEDFYTQRANHKYPKLDFTRETLLECFKRQLTLEQACTVTIDSIEATKPVTEKKAKMRKLLAEQQAKWHKILLQALRENKMILAKTNTKMVKVNLYPYFCLLEDQEYVDIMIQSITSLPSTGEALNLLAKDLGNRVYVKYCVQKKCQNQITEKLGNIYSAYTDLLAKDTKEYVTLPREHWLALEAEQSSGPTLQKGETQWPYMVTLQLGNCMIDMMIKNLKINSDILNPAYDRKLIPILYHMYAFRSTRQIGFIKPHPILVQIQQESAETKLTFDADAIPMLCPPLPWTSVNFGAHLLIPTKLMRTLEGATQHEILLEKGTNIHAVLDSLSQLGNYAWRINKPLLDIIISIFNDRGSDKLNIPPPLSEAPVVPHFNFHDPKHSASEKAHMKRELINARKKYNDMHSLRTDTLYKLSIANHMRDEIFWFPHNMDFRGRTYPCPPYFNHLGSDVSRSLLLFAEGKPLGPRGLDWLKIHLVNLTGLKKRSSLQGRLEYAETIMEDILDSADNPLNGKKWWMNADEPWQALGCCMEIANAVRSPDPTQFISHFPIHQDGSCNGLQHYSALGRDVIGATSVNLTPCDLPQDVYSGVAQQVEELRVRDAANGKEIAQLLEGFITRKVVKQTVMTVVYGVTRYGGRLQIAKRLKETDEFPQTRVWDASHYLVHLVFTSLKEMFTGTREIQDWLTESARLISKTGQAVQWVTPLGLPVIQPYHRTRIQVVKGYMQQINIQIRHDINKGPDTVKQKNAFPPNFIHSLDSTHMMLTALHCYSAGLTFVSVHDCFWTHALTVETMNKICREQFVALHSQPILQELSNFLLQKFCSSPDSEIKSKKHNEYRRLSLLLFKVPKTGDFDLQQVKKSTYFFS